MCTGAEGVQMLSLTPPALSALLSRTTSLDRPLKTKGLSYHWTLHWMDCGKTVFALLQYAAHGIRPDPVWSTITVIPTLLPPVILLRN